MSVSTKKAPSLISIIDIAAGLSLRNIKASAVKGDFIPITMIKVKDLYVDPSFQRLVITSVISKATHFRPELARPLIVFLRPSNTNVESPKLSIGDGQHTALLACLLSDNGGEQEVPCQVIVHAFGMTDEECIKEEAKMFRDLNQFRTAVTVIDQLRANIAHGQADALSILEKIKSMGVHVEKLGDEDGPEVFGYYKLMSALSLYGLESVQHAIALYQRLQNDQSFPKWNDINKPLNGGLIGGLAAVYHLKDKHLGFGDRAFAVNTFLELHLGKTNPTSKKNSLLAGTAGGSQSVLIARRIIAAVNNLTSVEFILKRNGDTISNAIEETTMARAGLGDPSKEINNKE